MPITHSPLRYPGGKGALFDLTTELLEDNQLTRGTYIEPYAGGAGLALRLLFEGAARRIVLNDLDPGIHAFWDAVVNRSEDLIDRIENTPVTMDEWFRQRTYHRSHSDNNLDLAFATLFLNRTNRSGVIKGGVIGGLAQDGDYKLDCRFNVEDIIAKIRRIARYRKDITVTMLDGEDVLREADTGTFPRPVLFIDPPYYEKGSGLYSNYYSRDDHAKLAAVIRDINVPWLLTYDYVPHIKGLYAEFNQYRFDLTYAAAVKRVGTELMVTSHHFQRVVAARLTRDDVTDEALAG